MTVLYRLLFLTTLFTTSLYCFNTKEATKEYFNMCMSKINENTIFVFDDINWSKEMHECWEEIKSDNRVSLSIDLYKLGLVFFHSIKIKSDYQLRNRLIF